MFSKKKLLRAGAVAVAAATALVLAGCSGSSSGTKTELSKDPVTLNFTFWGGDARVQATQKVIAAFEKENPNITVEPQFADWTGYWDQLATSTAAGDMPDVVVVDGALPDMQAADVIRRIRAMESPVRPHILISLVEVDAAAIMRAKRAGAQGYLLKPFNRGQLLEAFRFLKIAA